MQQPWEQLQSDLANKNVLVFGLGRQGGGVAVANTLAQANCQVRVTDQLSAAELAASVKQLNSKIETVLGQHRQEDIEWADLIIKNPAVPEQHPLIQLAHSKQIPVLGEAALALKYVYQQTIGVTGTRGKTTTTSLIAHILQTAGAPVLLAGNIPGQPLLATLPHLPPKTWLAVEISSFQLESLNQTNTSPHISVLTTIYPDHQDRYQNQEEYLQTKLQIFSHQHSDDIAVYQEQQPWSEAIKSTLPKQVEQKTVTPNFIQQIKTELTSALPGEHNWENIALAWRATEDLVKPEIIARAVSTFSGVEYRLQPVATINNVTFINDTTSTTPTSLEKALDTYPNQTAIFIIGGKIKNLPWSKTNLTKLAQQPAGLVMLQGQGTQEIQAAWEKSNIQPNISIKLANNFAEAVQLADKLATQQQAKFVILSPGFSSFDWFKNEFDRGDQFNSLVQKLKKK